MVQELRDWGEDGAAVWFERYWCGERGTWTIGDAGVGHVAHNNGVEGRWPKFSLAVCGSAGKSKQLKLDVMAGNMIKYIGDSSREAALKQVKDQGSHRFLRDPELTPKQWHAVQFLDIRILQHASLYTSEANRRIWRRMVGKLSQIEGPQQTPPGGALITQQIQIYNDEHGVVDINRMDIECIIAPSMMGLRALDMDGRFNTHDTLSARLSHLSAIYYDLMASPDEIATLHPGITAVDMLSLIDTFHLLQPVRGGTSFKCNCKEFFRDGICCDSTLFKMLWFPDHVVPDKYSAVQIPDRTTSRRPGVFARERDEPTFQTKVKAKGQVWAPSGMAGCELLGLSDSDEDEVAPPKPRQPVAPPKPQRKKDVVNVNDFLRRSEPPARYYSPDRETPARIAAMPEPDQYFFKEWLAEVRKKRAQVPAPP